MFDTHCHLNFEVFDAALDKTITTARQSGVTHFMVPGVNRESSEKALLVATNYINTYAAVGIHPTEDLEILDMEKEIFALEELLADERVKAIGECGLDYYKNEVGSATQQQFLEAQIKLANKHGLPLILHCRQAGKDIVDMLTNMWNPALAGKLIFHCCEADPVLLKFAVKNNVYMGVDGDVTYDAKKQDFVSEIPLELLLLETDSPFLTPLPVRDTVRFPNSPANLTHIAVKVAEQKNISTEEITTYTTENALRVFGLKK